MRVLASVLDDFVHDSLHARRGRNVELEESLARDLERKGLVEIKAQPLTLAPILREPVTGKSPAVGAGQVSSASPAVQASPQTTAKRSGYGKRRKGASS